MCLKNFVYSSEYILFSFMVKIEICTISFMDIYVLQLFYTNFNGVSLYFIMYTAQKI